MNKMIKAYKETLTNYFNFKGRASVGDYWWAVLMNFLITFGISVISGVINIITTIVFKTSLVNGQDISGFLTIFNIIVMVIPYLYSLAVCIPFMALAVRRLHDQNRSGWLLLLCYLGSLLCGIGGIIFIILMCLPGTDESNNYGPVSNVIN